MPMSISHFRRTVVGGGLATLLAIAACNGNIGSNMPTGSGGNSGLGGGNVDPGNVTVPPTPIAPDVAYVAVRKVKNLLTGLPPSDEDGSLVTNNGAAGLQMLVSTWQTTAPYKDLFRDKMI